MTANTEQYSPPSEQVLDLVKTLGRYAARKEIEMASVEDERWKESAVQIKSALLRKQ